MTCPKCGAKLIEGKHFNWCERCDYFELGRQESEDK